MRSFKPNATKFCQIGSVCGESARGICLNDFARRIEDYNCSFLGCQQLIYTIPLLLLKRGGFVLRAQLCTSHLFCALRGRLCNVCFFCIIRKSFMTPCDIEILQRQEMSSKDFPAIAFTAAPKNAFSHQQNRRKTAID